MNSELNKYRRRVSVALGSHMKTYLALMGCWFKGKLSKDEFDSKARDLFTEDTVKAHNEFLLAMLQRCQGGLSTLGSRDMNLMSGTSSSNSSSYQKRHKSHKKKPYTKANFSQRFQSANQLLQVQQAPQAKMDTKLRFMPREHGLLPDAGMIRGRIFVSSWEAGLEGADNDICTFVSLATELLLKNIISQLLCSCRGYRQTACKRVRHCVGIDVSSYSIPSAKAYSGEDPITEAARQEALAVQSLARCGHVTPTYPPVSAQDMFIALQLFPDMIASRSLYTLALERLSTRIYHMDNEELEASKIDSPANATTAESGNTVSQGSSHFLPAKRTLSQVS